MFKQVTPLIITYNEEANLQRTIGKLRWARKIVAVDSGSDDNTLKILQSYPEIEVFNHPFTDFATQCNFGLSRISTEWVLSLDSDYELSDALVSELESLEAGEEIGGYQAKFVYRVHGRPLRGSLYPPRVVLYRRNGARYRNEGHGHRVSVQGAVGSLAAPIYHDDRKSLVRWFSSQRIYVRQEVKHLLTSDRSKLSSIDRMRLIAWPAPLCVVVYMLFVKGCLLDGWPGLLYTLQRLVTEIMIAIEIIDHRLRGSE